MKLSAPAASSAERPLAGIAANAAAFTAISIGDAITKLAVAGLPAAQTLALRSFLIVLVLTPFFIAVQRRGAPVVRTSRPWAHLTRCGLQCVSVLTFYVCLRELPLTTVTAIMFVAPSLVALAAAPMLGERISSAQVVALAFGLVGCMIILRPSGDGQLFILLLALFSAATWALSMIMLRALTRTESQATIFAWSNGFLLLVSAALALFEWRQPTTMDLVLIVGIAVTQLVGQFFSMTAFRIARAATIAPVQYTQLLWATFFGAIIFREWPTTPVWIGAGFIIAGGLWLVRAERRRDV